jgi:uncharacterized membrane protein YjjP (DUF1212 family)
MACANVNGVKGLYFNPGEWAMKDEEHSGLILAITRALYVNGQATDQVVDAGQRFGEKVGLAVDLLLRWGELQLRQAGEGLTSISTVVADPTGINMNRVASAIQLVSEIEASRISQDKARERIAAIAKARPAPTWLFSLAAAVGAAALAIIFGIQHQLTTLLIFASAGTGALLRRAIARVSANIFIQPFCAALLAGLMGGLAVRYQFSSALRLVVVCPCMVLVPGPHFLNGAIDLIRGRIDLGAARLIYAGLVVIAISAGLLLGLAVFQVSLPVDPPGTAVPLWLDVLAAGVAVACYSTFFSTPMKNAGMAGGGQHAGPRRPVVCDHQIRVRGRNWRSRGLSCRRVAAGSDFAPQALAVRSPRFCVRGVDDTRRLRFQNDERSHADC